MKTSEPSMDSGVLILINRILHVCGPVLIKNVFICSISSRANMYHCVCVRVCVVKVVFALIVHMSV